MAYSMVHVFLQTRQQHAEVLSDEEVTEVLTRFVYRGLNGHDY